LETAYAALVEPAAWAALPRTVRWSVPEPVIEALESGYGPEAPEPVLGALAGGEAPVWLRINTLRADPARLAKELAGEGLATAPAPPDAGAPPQPVTPEQAFSPEPTALRWLGGERLPWETAAWRRGAFTVQDVGAMLAARLLDPRPGERVLDACAAPGGKTGQLWERMAGRGRLVAAEVDPVRRAELRASMTRLYGAPPPGSETAQPSVGIDIPDIADLADLEAGSVRRGESPALFDRILVDAPCQALGLIRRHPEIRWDGRLCFQSRMQATQRRILAVVARLAVPGGRLLWVTCSPTRAENEAIVLGWMTEVGAAWRMVDPRPLLGEAWSRCVQIDEGFVRTRPDRLDCDGFALALLERRAG
ncbi:MAG: RsmB/NOP family class I SAM-dependent RNA methyltransferase, partial [bacterium]|nr:RsmB/NOP family class I SAM-dependent RNA methyltransferase [bacterium]